MAIRKQEKVKTVAKTKQARDLRAVSASTLTAQGLEQAIERCYQSAAEEAEIGHMLNSIGKRLSLEGLRVRVGLYAKKTPSFLKS